MNPREVKARVWERIMDALRYEDISFTPIEGERARLVAGRALLPPEDIEDEVADYVVRAVNSHDDLLAACRELLDNQECTCPFVGCVHDRADAAIAKAKGQASS